MLLVKDLVYNVTCNFFVKKTTNMVHDSFFFYCYNVLWVMKRSLFEECIEREPFYFIICLLTI